MRVDIEKRRIGSYESIIRDANKSMKSAVLKTQRDKCQKALFQKNISIENKKKRLAKSLHELVITTFSANVSKLRGKRKIEEIRADIALIRKIIHKIKSINNYLEEAFLKELGIIKKSLVVRAVKSSAPVKYLEKSRRVLPKGYIDKIEHTVYELMQKIVFFDKKLLKDYKKKGVRVISTENLRIKDLEKILKIESEILDALEAKIPPPGKAKAKLFEKGIAAKWVPWVFALLSSFETEHSKEMLIFSKIKGNAGLRKKIENKIRYIINEKERMLKIKENRALSMKSLGKISEDYRQTFHEYVSAASL
ncbi:hypothetical protein KY347_05170 [Candidatus Woesearchaeota archaeon]|nr:hypothetical protein [Candidatus Woesearchaeota archaeon]